MLSVEREYWTGLIWIRKEGITVRVIIIAAALLILAGCGLFDPVNYPGP